jgi:CRP-like cAMP-binding protein
MNAGQLANESQTNTRMLLAALSRDGMGQFRSEISARRSMKNNLNEKIVRHSFFRDMQPQHLAILTGCASERDFRAGDIIFRQGEPANEFYLIEKGCVALEAHEPADGTVLVQELGAGEVLGWSWLFPPFAWRFGARAAEPTTVIVLNGARLLNASTEDHEFGYELMKRVAQAVIHRLQATRQQLLRRNFESVMEG